MRFHHSTRRGRNRFGQAGAGGGGGNHHLGGPSAGSSCGTGGKFGGHPSALSNRWAQLSYCRQTNLHFNRRLPVELSDEMRHDQLMRVLSDRTGSSKQNERQADLLGAYDTAQRQDPQIENLEQLDKLKIDVTSSKHPKSRKHTGKHLNQLQRHDSSNRSSSHSGGQQAQVVDNKASEDIKEDEEQQAGERVADLPTMPPTKLDLESARAKLIAQVDKHPFWSTKAAKRMHLLELEERQVYIYELTSYCERRDLEWRYKPYRGGKLGASSVTNIVATTTAASSSSHATNLTPPNTTGGGALRRAAASQPASPPPATPSGDQNPRHLMTLATQRSTAARGSPTRPSKFDLERFPTGGDLTATTARQSMRRSCSSAATSPVKGTFPVGGGGSHTAAQSPVKSDSRSFTFTPPATPPGMLGAPRPVPSADFVWSIEPPEHLRPQPFASYVHTSEVPGTSFLKKCHGCEGRGRLKCSSCYGVGYEVCLSCTGKGSLRTYSSSGGGGGGASASGRSLGPRSEGYLASGSGRGECSSMWDNAAGDSGGSRLGGGRYDEPGGIASSSGIGGGPLSSASETCASCSGMGQKRCWICAGRSYITCTACAGTGTLRCHLNLNITYLNHRDELCLNNSDGIIPRERLKLTTGLLLADEIANRLEPIASHKPTTRDGATSARLVERTTDQRTPPMLEQVVKPTELSQLSAMSARLLEKHAQTYLGAERLIKQRHKVTQIECFKIDWEFRKKRGHFVVYGDERKVYIAKYPFKSICNIT